MSNKYLGQRDRCIHGEPLWAVCCPCGRKIGTIQNGSDDERFMSEHQLLTKKKEKNIKCMKCGGFGWKSPGTPLQECPECEGIGYKQ